MCYNIYELDPANFLSGSRLAWQATLQKTEIELELLTNNDMLVMVQLQKVNVMQDIDTQKQNNKYMKNYGKIKESSYLMYLDANSLYGWAMSQKFPVDGFKWKINILKFN